MISQNKVKTNNFIFESTLEKLKHSVFWQMGSMDQITKQLELESPMNNKNSMEKEENEQLSSHLCDGVEYIYFTPSSQQIGYDFIAESIKTKDFNKIRVAIVCEHATNAQQVMREMGKRSVASLLLNPSATPAPLLYQLLGLQTEGLLTSVLIVSDDMLQTLEHNGKVKVKVDLLIHSSQTLPHVFQKRIQMLISTEAKERQVIVVRTPAPATVARQITTIKSKDERAMPIALLNQLEEDAMSSTSASSGSISIGLDNNLLYSYNRYEVLGRSMHKQDACSDISDIHGLDGRIKASMKQMGHERAKRPHRYAWPHVAKQRSLCVIGYKASGKTWSYLPWLCHSALQHAEVRKLGVCCIILCPDARHGELMSSWCEQLTSTKQKNCFVTLVRLFRQEKLQAVQEQLKNACGGILVTSVELLLQLLLLDKDAVILNPSIVQCIALEDINTLWQQSQKDCAQLFDLLFAQFDFGLNGSQLMISGHQWIESLMSRVLPKLNDVLLLFTDALEASVYGRIEQELLFIDPQLNEIEIIKVLLAENLQKKRVVLACDSNNVANGLKIHLMSAGIRSIVINEDSQQQTFKQWCNESKRNVLIAIDSVIPKLRAERIDCLIHYTPSSTWQRFKSRFSLFYGNYITMEESSPSNGTSIICITHKDSDLIWSMCNFLLKHQLNVPPAWVTAFQELRLSAERLNPKPELSMCTQMLCYGNCWLRNCQYRHEVTHLEQKPPLKMVNKLHIEFYLSFIHSPTRFVVKDTSLAIAHLAGGIPITKLEDSINLHYIVACNRIQHLQPKPNDVCVVQLHHRYQRVVVKRVLDNKQYIEVKQLDNIMDVFKVKATDLFVCKEHFIHEPFQCQELCLAGIMPNNMERIWSDEAKKLVLNVFFKERKTNRLCVFNADVDYDFDEKYFVHNIYDSYGNDLKGFLLNNLSVLNDGEVLSRLQELFK